MHAILVLFTLGPGTDEAADKTRDQFAVALGSSKGFKGVTMFADYEKGEYGGLSLWESKADAEGAMLPKMQEALASLLKAPPTARLFQVHELKA
jgi:hypothetical protein